MNNTMKSNSEGAADRCLYDREAAYNDDADVSMKQNEAFAHDEGDIKTAEPGNNAASGETMDDTSSSASEEVMSGAQSDQTANISSNGGYSGDYESISDSSSGASKKRKMALGVSGRHRRDAEDEKEEKSDDVMEDVGLISAQNRPSPLAAEDEDDSNMSVEYDIRRHHHHHAEADGKHQAGSGNNNGHHHHHHHHHMDRPNEARGQQVNRQINEIMNLYNVSLQAQANAHAHASVHADGAAATKQEGDALNNSSGDMPSEAKKESSKVNYHYQVQSNEHPLRRFSAGSSSQNDLPAQLGGFRIMDPSDPRIDLVKLYQASQSAAAGLGPFKDDRDGAGINHHNGNAESDEPQDDSNHNQECYNNLMKACRPFFQDSKTIMKSGKVPLIQTAAANQSQVGSDEATSSGFTSFFTTTKSDSNTNAGEGSSSQSEFSQNNKKKHDKTNGPAETNDSSSPAKEDKTPKPDQRPESPAHSNDQNHHHRFGEAYQSDSSSMVVLARMKRKHKEQRHQEAKKNGADENVSKRVRIETVALDAAKNRSSKSFQQQPNARQPESSSLSSGLSTSINSSESEGGRGGGGAQTKHTATTTTSAEDRSKTDSQSGSAENSNKQTARTVTDTSGTTTANNSSGSGTGSGNENKSESGSQIEGTSNSDEKRVYCEKDSLSDSNTVAAVNGDAKKIAKTSQQLEKPLIHHHNHAGKKIPVVDHTPKDPLETSVEEPEPPASNANAVITKEEKLMEKKRKRMSARKEYEEDLRQMRDSSESSSKLNDADVFEPGKPVTLEDVLSFSKSARLLVQALPPFLAVHTNAAFTLLTGIDSHTIIGQPVSSIIAIAGDEPPNKESDSSGSDHTNNKDTLSSLSGSVEGNEGRTDANMANANEASQQEGQEQPSNEGSMEANAQSTTVPPGFRIDRLIVARGYGHIHNVEVKTLERHTAAHAIEGSEVKIEDGKSGTKRKKKDDKIFCRMSVSPVVTDIESWDRKCEGHVDTKDHKRRKHTNPSNGFAAVKHYLIQLESMDGPCLLAKRSSFSSSTDTTVEAQLLGITRSELVARRCRMESNQRDIASDAALPSGNRSMNGINLPETDSQDENTSGVEPVATCG